jgi:hypothetical protein
MMGRRYIEVIRAKAIDAESAQAKRLELNQGDADLNNVVRVRGLPWEATTEATLAFFQEIGAVVEGGVHLVKRFGRPQGEALIEFENEYEAGKALAKNKSTFPGGRWLEIMSAAKGELYVYLQQQKPSPSGAGAAAFTSPSAAEGAAASGVKWVDPLEKMGGCEEGGPRVVKIEGLPLTITKAEIVAHFYGSSVFLFNTVDHLQDAGVTKLFSTGKLYYFSDHHRTQSISLSRLNSFIYGGFCGRPLAGIGFRQLVSGARFLRQILGRCLHVSGR